MAESGYTQVGTQVIRESSLRCFSRSTTLPQLYMSAAQPLIFRGIDGAECEEFIANLLQSAFDNGRARDAQYIADLASTCFRGEALRWYLDLDDDIHADWRRLRRAMITEYPQHSRRANEAMAPSAIPTPAAAPPARQFSRRQDGRSLQSSVGELLALSSANLPSIPRPVRPADSVPKLEPSSEENSPEDRANFDYRNRRRSRSPTRSKVQHRSRSTSSAYDNIYTLARSLPNRDTISKPSAARSIIRQDETLLPRATLAESKGAPTALHQPLSTTSLMEETVALPPLPPAPVSTNPPPKVDTDPPMPAADRPLPNLLERPAEPDLRNQEFAPSSTSDRSPSAATTTMAPVLAIGGGTLPDQNPSTRSVIRIQERALNISTLAPGKMTGRIRVITHDKREDRGYVANTTAIVNNVADILGKFLSLDVGRYGALFEVTLGWDQQRIQLVKLLRDGPRYIGATFLRFENLQENGCSIAQLHIKGEVHHSNSKSIHVNQTIWKLHDRRIEPGLPLDFSHQDAAWCEGSVILGHEMSGSSTPVLLLVQSSAVDIFTGNIWFGRRWEHVDFLFETTCRSHEIFGVSVNTAFA